MRSSQSIAVIGGLLASMVLSLIVTPVCYQFLTRREAHRWHFIWHYAVMTDLNTPASTRWDEIIPVNCRYRWTACVHGSVPDRHAGLLPVSDQAGSTQVALHLALRCNDRSQYSCFNPLG